MMGGGLSSEVRNNEGIISGPIEEHTPDPRGLGCILYEKIRESGLIIAQIDGRTGEEETYESLLKRCIRTAIKMRSKGINSEHIITISSYNNFDNCVPYIATLFLGAKITCLDPQLTPRDTALLLSQIRPKIIFAGNESIETLETSIGESGIETEIITFDRSTVYEDFSTFLEPSPDEETFTPVHANNLNDTTVIIFSSGTTGPPKGACFSHKSILYQVCYMWSRPEYAAVAHLLQTQISFISLYWIPTAAIFFNCLIFGKTRIIYPNFDIDTFWDVAERMKIEMILLTPNQVKELCTRGRPHKVDVSHLQQIIITGGIVSKEMILEVRTIVPGVDVVNLYGFSEAGGYLMAFRPHMFPEERSLLQEKPDSCGRPREGTACKVVDSETGEILGPNQKGELRIKTDFQMTGYYNVDSSRCWDAEGWLKAGEISYYDEDNCFYIVDRMKDMLRFRSWYLAPAKIEGVLLTHPAVDTAVVIGLPHPDDGEHPLGIVVLRDHAVGSVCGEDIRDYVDRRVEDPYRLRGGIRIVNYIPVTSSGKNRRAAMKELLFRNEI